MKTIVLFLSLAGACFGYSPYHNWCQQGGVRVQTQGLSSSGPFQQSYPNPSASGAGPSVTVYFHGTSNKATLYSDNNGTSLGNPFVCSSTGEFQFYAANNVYDVTIAGTGITTYTYTVTSTDGCPTHSTCDAGYDTLAHACEAAGSGPLYITQNWVLPSGNFSCGAPTVAISAGITVSLSGSTSTWQVNSNQTITCGEGGGAKNTTAHGGVFSFFDVTNSGIQGCTLVASNGSPQQPTGSGDGNAIALSGANSQITLEGLNISGHEFSGVFNSGTAITDHLTVKDNYFHDGTVSTGFTSGAASGEIQSYGQLTNSNIQHNTMLSFNDYGTLIGPGGGGTATNIAAGNSVQNNDCENKNVYGDVLYGGSVHAAISACTNESVAVCTTSAAPATGTTIEIYGGTGAWQVINSPWIVTNLSPTTFSIPLDSMSLGAVSGSLNWTGNVLQYNTIQNETIKNISSRTTSPGNNNGGECVYVVQNEDTDVVKNYCENAMQNRTGLSLPLGAISMSDTFRGRVLDNRVVNSNYHCYSLSAGLLPSVSIPGPIFGRNICEGATHFGLGMANISGTQISVFSASNTGGDCISLTASPSTKIEQAALVGCGGNGIETVDAASPHLTITDSTIDTPGLRGIFSQGDSPSIHGSQVHGATGNLEQGIYVISGGSGVGGDISGNEVYNNYQGIGSDGSLPQLNLTGNSVYSNSNANWVLTGDGFTATGNTNLSDHTNNTVTITTTGMVTIAGAGGCGLISSTAFPGATSKSFPQYIPPISPPSNWAGLIPNLRITSGTLEFFLCTQLSQSNTTPDSAVISVNVK